MFKNLVGVFSPREMVDRDHFFIFGPHDQMGDMDLCVGEWALFRQASKVICLIQYPKNQRQSSRGHKSSTPNKIHLPSLSLYLGPPERKTREASVDLIPSQTQLASLVGLT